MGKQRNLLTYALVDLTMLLVLGGMIPSICQAQGNQGYSLLRNIEVTGFLTSTFGTFIDSEAIEYNKSKNSLSSARQTLQIDVNGKIGEHDRFFMRDWFVYEPNY
ncbi:MAG TPA: hypothetical protein VGY99_21580, partial [Candidatus Binataceae bacterium]|nr:hypothetical protein [Candidatus Binataceae bacterium]